MSTYIKLFLDTRRINSKNAYPIKFRIIHNRIPTTLKTGFSVENEYWDAKYLRVKRGSKLISNHVDFNSLIKKMDSHYTETIINLQKDGLLSSLSIKELKAILSDRNEKSKPLSFVSFAEKLIKDLRKEGRIGTANSYKLPITLLKKYHGSDILFEQITPSLLQRLEKRYMSVPNNHYNGLSVYLRAMRAIYNKAIAVGIIDAKHYPFRRGAHETNKYQIKHEKTKKRAISKEEITKIELFNHDSQSVINSKYLFLFSFYTLGMNMTDMAYLRKSDIKNNILKYKRKKTGKMYEIRLPQKAVNILEYFDLENKKPNDFLLPILSDKNASTETQYRQIKNSIRLTNKKLKLIGRQLELNIELTTYVSRHSWATIADKAGIDRRTISQALGHSNLNTTNIYINDIVSSNNIFEANDLIVQ